MEFQHLVYYFKIINVDLNIMSIFYFGKQVCYFS